MWKTIRSALPNKSGRPSFTKDTDTLANEFNRFFVSVGQKAADDSAELARLHDLCYQLLLFIAVQLTVMSCLTSKQ